MGVGTDRALVGGMTGIHTILVPIDFSDCTAGVVEQAAHLAAGLGAEVTLLHAAAVPPGTEDTQIIPAGSDQPVPMKQHLRRGAEERMVRYVELSRSRGAATNSVFALGHPVESILSVEKEVGADLIVMGTHGRTGLRRLLLGSVAERVLRSADAPVMTVRSRWHDRCQAASCAVCTSHRYPELDAARAELDG